jgi:hypothetical protein
MAGSQTEYLKGVEGKGVEGKSECCERIKFQTVKKTVGAWFSRKMIKCKIGGNNL